MRRAGEELGGYELLRVIGSGGMGTVYEAVDADRRHVALKLLHPQVSADPQARDRLRREVATLHRVRHTGVARVLDAEADADEAFVVTELIDGQTLEESVEEHGPFEPDELAALAHGLHDGLVAIHDSGVVHRDVKPSNVMLTDDGPVLIDFGISQILDDVRVTQTGLVTGTPGYIDPQLVAGAAPGEAGDWWGWAAVLVFAATGHAPFGQGPMEVVLARVTRGDVDTTGLPPRVAAAARACLVPAPGARQDPASLLAAIDAEAAGAGAAAAGERTAGSEGAASGPAGVEGATTAVPPADAVGTVVLPAADRQQTSVLPASDRQQTSVLPAHGVVASAGVAAAGAAGAGAATAVLPTTPPAPPPPPPGSVPTTPPPPPPGPALSGAASTGAGLGTVVATVPGGSAGAAGAGPVGAGAVGAGPAPAPSTGGAPPMRAAAPIPQRVSVTGPYAPPPPRVAGAPPGVPPAGPTPWTPAAARAWGTASWPGAPQPAPGAVVPAMPGAPGGAVAGAPAPGAVAAPQETPAWARPAPARAGLVAWLGVVVACTATTWPGWAAVGFAAAMVVAAATGSGVRAVRARRLRSGPRRSDVLVASLGSPLHVLRGALLVAVSLAIGLLGGIGVWWFAGMAAGGGIDVLGGPAALSPVAQTIILGVASWVTVALTWLAPTSGLAREGTRSVLAVVAPGPAATVVLSLTGLVLALVAVGLALTGTGAPSWVPLPGA